MKFRKKPVEIEARHFTGDAENATPIIDWILDNGGTATWREAAGPEDNGETGHNGWPEAIRIKTLEGVMEASPGDWIIRGVEGEFYPCKPDIFAKTYVSSDSSDLTAADLNRQHIGSRLSLSTATGALIEDKLTLVLHGVSDLDDAETVWVRFEHVMPTWLTKFGDWRDGAFLLPADTAVTVVS